MRFDRLGVGLGLSLLLFAPPAFAIGETGECASDADCAAGLGCVERTYTICEDASPAGGAGGEGARGGEVGCYEVVEHACAPKPCTTDAECGGGTSCVGFTYVVCSGGDEPGTGGRPDPGPGGEGGAGGEPDTGAGAAGGSAGGAGGSGGAPPVECVEIFEAYCVPPWLAPCVVDADCGPGFRCIEDVICTEPPPPPPGGAGGMGGAGGGACGPSDVKHCELIPTPCGTSADCAAGLTCEDFSTVICGDDEPGEPPPPPDGGAGGAGGRPGGDDDGTGGRPNEGGAGGDAGGAGGAGGGPDCRDEPLSLCVPPGFVDWLGAYGPGGGRGDETGYGGRGGSAPSAEDADAAGADAEDGGALGCQAGGVGGGFSILALLGVALLLRRR